VGRCCAEEAWESSEAVAKKDIETIPVRIADRLLINVTFTLN
jgi:hypothetical protein